MTRRMNVKGFTLVELMLAMTVFSAVMVVATVGFIGMNRTFNRGLIRKDLSQYSQTVTEGITRDVRSIGPTVAVDSCAEGATDCVTDRSAVCLGAARYTWNGSGEPGGLYKDAPASCGDVLSSNAETVVADRYVVRDFKVERLTSPVTGAGFPDSLFRVSGVFTTEDDDALFFGDPSFDPNQVRCLGTAQAAAVRTCAVERFNFVINARGE